MCFPKNQKKNHIEKKHHLIEFFMDTSTLFSELWIQKKQKPSKLSADAEQKSIQLTIYFLWMCDTFCGSVMLFFLLSAVLAVNTMFCSLRTKSWLIDIILLQRVCALRINFSIGVSAHPFSVNICCVTYNKKSKATK